MFLRMYVCTVSIVCSSYISISTYMLHLPHLLFHRYKNPPYSSEQNNMDSLGDSCCSKKVGEVTCVSGTGKDAGGSWYDGSCDGICGAAGGGSVTFVSM